MNLKTSLRTLSLALLLAVPGLANAISLADGKLFIYGNGQWSYQATSAEAVYLEADPDGDWHTAMFDLLMVARPTDELTLNAQMGFEASGEGSLEWAFLDWKFSDAFRLRLGKVKQPLGNYAELQFTGTARPFYDLATGVYGPNNIAAEAYQGIGLTGDVPFGDGWSFQYDVWGGALMLPTYEPFDWYGGELAGAQPPPSIEEERVENLIGLRASIAAPNQWTFRLSTYGGNVEKDEGERVDFYVAGASAWYRGEKLWFSAETFLSDEVGFERTLTGYVEAAWFLTEKIQVAGRYEISRTDVDELKASDRLLKHDAYTVGANYWITPVAAIKASVDYVNGSRFLLEESWGGGDEGAGTVTAPLTERPAADTFRFVVGTQFTF
jgi:hypothetical protein